MQENIEQMHQLMMDDRPVTISQIVSSVGITHVKVWSILLNELGMLMVRSHTCQLEFIDEILWKSTMLCISCIMLVYRMCYIKTYVLCQRVVYMLHVLC